MKGENLKNREPFPKENKGHFSKENRGSFSKENRMLSYLERLQRSGAELFVDGEAVLPGDVLRQTVQEQCTYMADYVLGENGTIEQVRFDRVEL